MSTFAKMYLLLKPHCSITYLKTFIITWKQFHLFDSLALRLFLSWRISFSSARVNLGLFLSSNHKSLSPPDLVQCRQTGPTPRSLVSLDQVFWPGWRFLVEDPEEWPQVRLAHPPDNEAETESGEAYVVNPCFSHSTSHFEISFPPDLTWHRWDSPPDYEFVATASSQFPEAC